MNRLALRMQCAGFRLDAIAQFDRELIVVSGENGAGKTTLLRAVAGLSSADGYLFVEGRTWLDTMSGVRVAPERREIGFVWSEPVLLPWMNVISNIRLGAEGQPESWTWEICAAFEVEVLLDRHVSNLSAGEAQRVMLARAFHRRPKLLLMDEPLSAQAPAMRQRLRHRMMELRARLDVPLIMVSHDVEDGMIADRRWRMRRGRIFCASETVLDEDMAWGS